MADFIIKLVIKIIFAVASVTMMILVSGLRYVRGDTTTYRHKFELLPLNLADALTQRSTEKGFIIYLWLLKNIWDNSQFFLFVTSVITLSILVYIYYKYSTFIELSIFLFIASGCFGVTMNGLRQYLAAAVLIIGFKWVVNKRWWVFFLLVMIASSIHTSAIIMLPLYFVLRQRAWTFKTVFLICAAFAFIMFADKLLPFMFDLLEDTKYLSLEKYYVQASVIRPIVAFIPLALAFIYRVRLKERFHNYIDVVVNFSLLNFFFYLAGTVNNNFARLCIYTEFFNYLLFAWILTCIPRKDLRNCMYVALVLVYLAYFTYDYTINRQIVYTSQFLHF
jgi:transmembrane protein EpsG